MDFVIVGAEKLCEHVAKYFMNKFDIPVIKGYGCTELSPVVCVGVPNGRYGVKFHGGHKSGTVGRVIPGVLAKILNPETGEPHNHNIYIIYAMKA